uniref:Lipoprotein n=2 Tax=Phyllobacteriaceae TaxID=69277 RepID=Q11H08_CHESB
MKIMARIRHFSAAGLAAPCLISLLISGCAGTGSRSVTASPTQPDGYPNLNMPMEAAAPQISAEEKTRMTEELSGKRLRPENSQASAAETERLRRLALERQQEMLSQIESPADR